MLKKIKYIFRDLPLKSYLIYLCVALFLTTGVTFSRYVTSTTAGDSARVAKFGDLTLTEPTKPEKFIFAPGFSITKDPQISFSANELSAYIFAEITAAVWDFFEVSDRYIYSYDGEKLTWEINNTDWTLVSYDNETKKAVFYMLVPPGTELDGIPIIKNNAITVSENVKASDMEPIEAAQMDIVIKAYAAQSGGFENAASAWDSVKNK